MSKAKRFVVGSILAVAFASVLGSTGRAHAWHRLVVDDDRVECPRADYTSIQDAVDAAATSIFPRTIQVCAGTYVENVVIPEDVRLQIRGSGRESTIVSAVPGTPGPVFGANGAAYLSIENLTVTGQGMMGGDELVWGVRLQDTSGLVSNINVFDIRNPSGSAQGFGISVDSSSAHAHVRIQKNLLENVTRTAIRINGPHTHATVVDNLVVGPELPKRWAPNGIQVSRGAEARVHENEVFETTSPNPSGGAGSGILLLCAGRTSITKNDIGGSDLGISIADTAWAWIVQNDIDDSAFDGISLQVQGDLFGDQGCPGGPPLTRGNTIAANSIRNSAGNGISLVTLDPSGEPEPKGNFILKNWIRDSALVGIWVFHGRDNKLAANRVEDSGEEDARDDTIGSRTAGTANWWLFNLCDSSTPPGLCF